MKSRKERVRGGTTRIHRWERKRERESRQEGEKELRRKRKEDFRKTKISADNKGLNRVPREG